MSLAVSYTVMCDDCSTWVDEFHTAREARQAAIRSGWARIPGVQHGGKFNGGRDLCRRCAALAAQPSGTTPTGGNNQEAG